MRKYSLIGDSKYKYISIYRNIMTAEYRYRAVIKEDKNFQEYNLWYSDEKELAKKVDLELIRRGLNPVNILKKIQ